MDRPAKVTKLEPVVWTIIDSEHVRFVINIHIIPLNSFAFNSRIFDPRRCSRNLKRISQIFQELRVYPRILDFGSRCNHRRSYG